MTSRRTLAEDEIFSLFNQEDENGGDEPVESASESEYHLSEDDVQSDIEDIESQTILTDAPNEEDLLQSDSSAPLKIQFLSVTAG